MALVTSILTGGSNNHETTSEEANAVYTDFASEGIVGAVENTSGVAPATGGFAVNAKGTPGMAVDVSAGVAYVTATPTSQSSQTLRVKNTATAEVTISANSSGSTKYDWVYISISAANAADPNTAGDNVATLTTSRSSSASSDDGTPPTYGYPLAVVTVANGASSITNGNIADARVQTGMQPIAAAVATVDWGALGTTPNSITNNGNRSYSLVFNGTDLTDTVSNGMRLKLTRTVTAPTQCTDLESGSSQYYSKSSPSGMTFTDDFVVSAWIKLESYAAMAIASRQNGTSGWKFSLTSDGRLEIYGYNGAIGNNSGATSYQSIPLNKWVHVTAQLDMSAFTATSTTTYMMIDGVDVPCVVSRAGTNPTALVQAGDLQVGAVNGAAFFDGKLAQVAIYSAKVTQANIRATMSQGLSGSETSLISAYSFNNSIADLNTSNANNLTANGSAVATNADTPFAGGATGTTEYGIITANSFSTNTTLTVQVPEGYAIPTSGGVSAVSYSTHSVPYGFPRDKNKWRITQINKASSIQDPTANTYYNLDSNQITLPVGAWEWSYESSLFTLRSGASTATTQVELSTSSSASTDELARVGWRSTPAGVATVELQTPVAKTGHATLTSATTYYLLVVNDDSATTQIQWRNPVTITASLNYV